MAFCIDLSGFFNGFQLISGQKQVSEAPPFCTDANRQTAGLPGRRGPTDAVSQRAAECLKMERTSERYDLDSPRSSLVGGLKP